MAIRVENAVPTNRNDYFKLKCRRCGRELSYTRRDVRRHRRWPNGFIFCPACKTPNGHREDNLVERGEVYVVNEYVRKQEEIKKAAEKYSKEGLEKDLRSYSVKRTIFLAVGIPLLSISFIAFVVLPQITEPYHLDDNIFYIVQTLLSFIFAGGLALFIIGLVLGGKIKQRRELLAVKISEEAQKQKEQNNG